LERWWDPLHDPATTGLGERRETLLRLHSENVSLLPNRPAPQAVSANTLAQAIKHVGQPKFLGALAEFCETISGYDSTFIAAYFDGQPPVALFDNLGTVVGERTIKPYLDFAYMLDPFYDLLRKGKHGNVVSLSDCAPDDFLTSEYYQAFYLDTGLYDETSLHVPFGPQASLVLSLGSRHPNFTLRPQGRESLLAYFPCIAELCARHWPSFTPDRLAEQGRIGAQLDKLFARFSTSVLSEREAEIVRMILKGHSSKSIARLLGNSPETVKVHRKRIHAKLGIASQGELFSLFLDALSNAPSNATEDPLVYLTHGG